MTPGQVAAVLGDVEFLDNPELSAGGPYPKDETVTEFRVFTTYSETHLPDATYYSNELQAVDVGWHLERLHLDDVYLFKNTPTVTADLLTKMSKHYAFDDTSYVFLDLGISMALDDWDEAPPVHLFSKGEFDEFVEEGVQQHRLTLVRP